MEGNVKIRDMNIFFSLEGKGKTLLFIHGWGTNREIWRYQLDFFKDYFQVLLLDLPGHGKSTDCSFAALQTLDDLSLLIIELLKALRIAKVEAGIGWSVGSAALLKTYAKMPNLFSHMVLVSSSAELFSSKENEIGIPRGKVRKMIRDLEKDYEGTMKGFYQDLLDMERFSAAEMAILNSSLLLSLPKKRSAIEILKTLLEEKEDDTAFEPEIPTLILHGLNDGLVPLKGAHSLKKKIKGSQLHIFPQAGHLPFISQKEAFNRKVKLFLDG